MSGRVDVLAVMDEACGAIYIPCDCQGTDDLTAELREACAAVAGLLDAIDRVFHEWDNIGPALDKLRYARSNIGASP